MIFIFLSAVAMMNMLIGVICEVVTAATANEKDEAAIKVLKEGVLVELEKHDLDGNGMISKNELDQVINDNETLTSLHKFGIDLQYLSNLNMMLFAEPDVEVSIYRIMGALLSSRKDLPTTFRHLAENQEFLHWLVTSALDEQEDRLLSRISAMIR